MGKEFRFRKAGEAVGDDIGVTVESKDVVIWNLKACAERCELLTGEHNVVKQGEARHCDSDDGR